jgi:hypothetical protein
VTKSDTRFASRTILDGESTGIEHEPNDHAKKPTKPIAKANKAKANASSAHHIDAPTLEPGVPSTLPETKHDAPPTPKKHDAPPSSIKQLMAKRAKRHKIFSDLIVKTRDTQFHLSK